MSINININGTDYTGFTSIEVSRGFLDASGAFDLEISLGASEGTVTLADYPIKVGDAAKITVEGQRFLTGYVEKCDVRQTQSSITIGFSGRDVTTDVIDGTMSYQLSQGFPGAISLTEIMRTVLKDIGITDVKVVKGLGVSANDLFFEEGKTITPSEGQSVISYFQKAAGDKGFFINTTGNSDLVIIRGDRPDETTPIKLLLQIDGKNNNILESSVSIDNTKRFYDYIGYSQPQLNNFQESDKPSNTGLFNGILDPGTVVDNEIRKTRSIHLETNLPLDKDNTKTRMEWELALRRGRSVQYNCKVQGYTYDGINVWKPNLQIKLIDEYAQVSGTFLVDHVKFVESLNDEATELNLVNINTYKLQAELTKQQDQAEQLGNGYKASFK